jgi:YVTN family beta-propeller protein
VANSDDNTISVINVAKRKVVAVIPAPGGPLGISIPATGGVGYVATRDGDILALGLADHRFLGTVFRRPNGQLGTMDYDAVTGEVYVPDAVANAIYVLRPATAGGAGTLRALPDEPARVLPFSGGPAAVAITFDGAYGFVAERDAGRVEMFDPASRQVLATIDVGAGPRALVTAPYPAAPEVGTGGGSGPATWLLVTLAVVALLLLAGGGYVARKRFFAMPAVPAARTATPASPLARPRAQSTGPSTGAAAPKRAPTGNTRHTTTRAAHRSTKARSRRRGSRR